jgi:hypothetical protein
VEQDKEVLNRPRVPTPDLIPPLNNRHDTILPWIPQERRQVAQFLFESRLGNYRSARRL